MAILVDALAIFYTGSGGRVDGELVGSFRKGTLREGVSLSSVQTLQIAYKSYLRCLDQSQRYQLVLERRAPSHVVMFRAIHHKFPFWLEGVESGYRGRE